MTAPAHSLFARAYDLLMVPNDRFGLRDQRARLCANAAGAVLEIGVGTGLNLRQYRRADLVVGIDADRGMLHRAIHRSWESTVPVRLIAADAGRLPFPAACFDTVVVAFALCTIADPVAALDELARVANPGGTLHFLEHVRSAGRHAARFQDRLSGAWKVVSGGCRINQDTGALLDASPWSIDSMWSSRGGGLIQGIAVRS
ncbi:MAG: class I SAM-dependent methyltransferase [Acidimicrobiia bacterium]